VKRGAAAAGVATATATGGRLLTAPEPDHRSSSSSCGSMLSIIHGSFRLFTHQSRDSSQFTTPCVAVVIYILMSSVHIRLSNGGCDYIPVSCAALCLMKCEFNLSTNLNLKIHFY